MPALFARCQNCQYRFHFDYDFRQSRCSKCYSEFDWKDNHSMDDSLRGDSGGTAGGSAPILPGEPGHADYAQAAREEHDRSSLPHGTEQPPHDINTTKDRNR